MTPTVQYDARQDRWNLGGRWLSDGRAGNVVVIGRGDLATTKATDLTRALRKARTCGAMPNSVQIDATPDDGVSIEGDVVEPVAFVLLDDGRLGVRCDLVSDVFYSPFELDDELEEDVARLAEPLLRRSRTEVVMAGPDSQRYTGPFYHWATLATPTRGKSLEALYQVAQGVRTLFRTASQGRVTRETLVDLIAGGRSDLLVGQPEGPWLDVKSAHYDLTTPKGKISLAQAVSRFANAEEGGIVVVGMGTKKIRGGELIDSIRPVPVDTATVRRYRQVIENHLFPFPVGLEIRSVQINAGEGLVVVSLPPQEEELKPFLVHGAIVGDRVEGAYISIVRRSGEDSIPITAQQIHGALAAGRALMRRGYIWSRPEEIDPGLARERKP